MRRLSNGANYLGAFVDEADNELDMVSVTPQSRRTSASCRRRSTFSVRIAADSTKNQPKSTAEQNRIAEMYKVVIKMSAQNKINMKNSWSFDLIDQMGKLIRDDGKGGVNFQKASCTLDASIKIYSHRVDDTHASSHRILESLSHGNEAVDNDANENGGDDNQTSTAKPAKLGSKSTSKRLNIETTIEKNVDKINHATFDRGQAADPTFFKLSKAFDEGGARGMLMNNLCIDSSSSTLCFYKETVVQSDTPTESLTNQNSTDLPHRRDEVAVTSPAMISRVPVEFNLHELISKAGIDVRSLRQMKLCDDLEDYRTTLGIRTIDPEEVFSLFDSLPFLESASENGSCQSPVETTEDYDATNEIANDMQVCNNYNPPFSIDADCGDDYDDGGCYGCYNDEDAHVNHNSTQQGSGHNSVDHLEHAVVTPCRIAKATVVSEDTQNTAWEPLFVPVDGYTTTTVEDFETTTTVFEQDAVPTQQIDIVPFQNDYSYFNVAEMMDKQNAWTEAKHWKFGGRLRSAAINAAAIDKPAVGDRDRVEANIDNTKTKKNRKKTSRSKESDFFDFTTEPTARDSFAIAKKVRTNSTLLATLSQEKQTQCALQGADDLPPDANLEVKDLCRLFLSPCLIVPPTRNRYGKVLTSKFIGETTTNISSNERIWGVSNKATIQKFCTQICGQANTSCASNTIVLNSCGNHANDDCGDDDEYGGDYDTGSNDNSTYGHFGMASAAGSNRLEINAQNLMKASRVIEKFEIGYATTSSKVNVRKLKTNIWDHIHRSIHSRSETPGIDTSIKATTDSHVSVGTENVAPTTDAEDDRSEGLIPVKPKPLAVKTTTPLLSFKSLIVAVDHQQEQTNVSLPYYFICLLHLANERSLEIKGTDKMDDLFITGSSC